MRFFKIFFLLFILFNCKNSESSKTYSLKEGWQYRPGFDIEWLSSSGQEAEWKTITLPTNLTKELNLNRFKFRQEYYHDSSLYGKWKVSASIYRYN